MDKFWISENRTHKELYDVMCKPSDYPHYGIAFKLPHHQAERIVERLEDQQQRIATLEAENARLREAMELLLSEAPESQPIIFSTVEEAKDYARAYWINAKKARKALDGDESEGA